MGYSIISSVHKAISESVPPKKLETRRDRASSTFSSMLGSFADNIPSWVNLCTPRSRRNIGQQECISSFLRESLYKYVLGSLKKYPNRAFLATSNNFLDLDHQIILDFLDESGLNDTSPQSVLQIAAAWLQRNHEISRPDAVGNKESGIHLKSFVINLKLHDIRTSFISELWGEESPHTTDILAFRSSQLLQEFLVMPDVGDLSGFICHNVETGENFYLDPPMVGEQNGKFFGAPKLCVAADNYMTDCRWDPANRSLYCIRGVKKEKGTTIISR